MQWATKPVPLQVTQTWIPPIQPFTPLLLHTWTPPTKPLPSSPSPPEDPRATVAHIPPIPPELVYHFSACTAALWGKSPNMHLWTQTSSPPMTKRTWTSVITMLNSSNAGRALQYSSHGQTLFPCTVHRLQRIKCFRNNCTLCIIIIIIITILY